MFLIGFILTIGLIATFVGAVITIVMGYPFMQYLLPDSPFIAALTIICAFILLAVPIFTLMDFIQRITMNRRVNPKTLTGAWVAWSIALIGGASFGSVILRDFKVGKEVTQNISTDEIYSDTLQVEFGDNPYSSGWMHFGPNQIFDDELINTYHRIRVEKTDGDDFEISQKKCSQGRNITEAEQLAYNIDSEPITTFNSIQIPSYFSIPKGTKYRGQHLETVIKIPEGKYISFGERENGHGHYNIDYNRKYDQPWVESGQIWKMSDEGLMLPSYAENPNELSFSDFKNIEITGDIDVEIEKSDQYEVSMRGRSRYKKQVDFKQEGDMLKVEFDGDRHRRTLRLFIKAPDLESVSLFDTDDVKIEDFDFENFEIKSSGRTEIRGDFNAQNLTVNLEKDSKLWLKGEADYMMALMEDRAYLYADDFDVRKAEIKTRDDEWKRIHLSVSDTLYKDVIGHPELRVDGRPWELDRVKERENAESELNTDSE